MCLQSRREALHDSARVTSGRPGHRKFSMPGAYGPPVLANLPYRASLGPQPAYGCPDWLTRPVSLQNIPGPRGPYRTQQCKQRGSQSVRPGPRRRPPACDEADIQPAGAGSPDGFDRRGVFFATPRAPKLPAMAGRHGWSPPLRRAPPGRGSSPVRSTEGPRSRTPCELGLRPGRFPGWGVVCVYGGGCVEVDAEDRGCRGRRGVDLQFLDQ
jgi:hypothetical protein